MVYVLSQQVRRCGVANQRRFASWVIGSFSRMAGVNFRASESGLELQAENEWVLSQTVEKLRAHCEPRRLETTEAQIIYARNPLAEPVMKLTISTPWPFEHRIRSCLAARKVAILAVGNWASAHMLWCEAPLSRLLGIYEEIFAATSRDVHVDMQFSHYQSVGRDERAESADSDATPIAS